MYYNTAWLTRRANTQRNVPSANPGDLPHTADRRLARLLDPVSRETLRIAGYREAWELEYWLEEGPCE